MQFLEVDMLAVNNADALIVRAVSGDLEHVTIIDGGNPGDGAKVVRHIRERTWRRMADVVICTHPDRDHIGGLFDVVREIPVGEVWVHDPRLFVDVVRARRNLTEFAWLQFEGLKRLSESLQDNLSFIDLVDALGIPRKLPLVGHVTHPVLQVCGPTPAFYGNLLTYFDRTDLLLKDALLMEDLVAAEGSESLDEHAATTAPNNSSVICAAEVDEAVHLFTGDAGIPALWEAVQTAGVSQVTWLQVPHHGSKYNLSNALVQLFRPRVAMISAAGTRKHPSRAVINALKSSTTGCLVASTHKSGNLWYCSEPQAIRADYIPIDPV